MVVGRALVAVDNVWPARNCSQGDQGGCGHETKRRWESQRGVIACVCGCGDGTDGGRFGCDWRWFEERNGSSEPEQHSISSVQDYLR
ncbi:hypothetical protein SESBI_41675 [Sesbania bispinosa]|nr:hypothetical protein SESBI_41675 [Sesbania bispinosa]